MKMGIAPCCVERYREWILSFFFFFLAFFFLGVNKHLAIYFFFLFGQEGQIILFFFVGVWTIARPAKAHVASRIINRTEYLPVAVDISSLPGKRRRITKTSIRTHADFDGGSDLCLLSTIRRFLEHYSDRAVEVPTGRRMFQPFKGVRDDDCGLRYRWAHDEKDAISKTAK